MREGAGGARLGGGLLVMVGRGARGGMAARAPMLLRAAVMVAAVMLAMAALMLDMEGIPGRLGSPIGPMLGIPIPMGRGRGRGRDSGVGEGAGSGSWMMALGRRLSGIGTPAFAHMAAALALAISSNWSLSSSVSRGGVLLVLRRGRDPERRWLRRMRTGEWLGSLFHLSRRSRDPLRYAGLLTLPLERDLRLRSEERDRDLRRRPGDLLRERLPRPVERLRERFLRPGDLLLERLPLAGERLLERLPLAGDLLFDRLLLDLFPLPGERLFDRLLRSVDLERLLPPRAAAERLRERLFLAGERDLDLRVLVRDLEEERLRRAGDRERLDLLRRPGLRDLDLFLLRSVGDLDFLLTGDLDLDFFLWDLEAERRVDEVERDSCRRFTGDRDLESSFFGACGDAEGLPSV